MAAPQKNAWSYGLFDCFGDGGICLHVCCCPCCAYGQEMEMFHMGTAEPLDVASRVRAALTSAST
jgi:Cys-rich protein (TIGR01571 family)